MEKIHVVIIGAGAAGIAIAASLLKRQDELDITIIDPREKHFYQPGWTMVGAGVFSPDQTERAMEAVIPSRVVHRKLAVEQIDAENNTLELSDKSKIKYQVLVVAPGLKLNWDAIDGAEEALGSNGVCSNYQPHLAEYTWKTIQGLKSGEAIFTQAPMPIKCAGAPQKAMYLACDHWLKAGLLRDINVSFHNAGGVLFGVKEYVPSLMEYVEKYKASLCFNENLTAVDGIAQKAYFEVTDQDGNKQTKEQSFDMLHICPPQAAHEFVKDSAISNEAGWVDVDKHTLQHTQYKNVFSLGDACSTPNAKTAAAVRKQSPIVAENILSFLDEQELVAQYDGYGSCPLTVENGKIVLAEFGYDGKLLPTFPDWFLNGKKPSSAAWYLKKQFLPYIYFNFMLKGHEWLTETEMPKIEKAKT